MKESKGSDLSKKELSVKIGLRIKEIRSELGINQAELARRIHKDSQHVELIENGKVSPNIYTLYIITKGLNTSLPKLLEL